MLSVLFAACLIFVWSVCAGSPHFTVVEGLVCLGDRRGFVVRGFLPLISQENWVRDHKE